mgnify:CR=1 FL=1|tara:strand:+ start:133 stop:612 length:480 start_codon:yes stop_codon:yes gene_type:complete
MSLLNKEAVKRVEKTIKKFDQNLEVIELSSSARTAIDAAKLLKCEVGAIVKSLLFKADNNFVLCLVSGDKRCSLNKLKKIINTQNVSMATPEEVKQTTGFTIGGVSPVGHIKELKIYIDSSLSRFKEIFAAAGHPNCIFKINYESLIGLSNGEKKDFVE